MIALQDKVRKWEGLERMDGRCERYAKRIAFPILAWFLSPNAEMRVAMILNRAAKSTEPGETRSCECGW